MFQVRIHGRGGQGVVAAAEILSTAAFDEGRFAQAFPSFGSERMGAPVVSYCKIDDKPIRSHEPITEPDALIVQDATLVHQVDLFAGLATDAYVLINTSQALDELGLTEVAGRIQPGRLITCPATALALLFLGRPLPNAALLGGFAALSGQITLDALERAIRERFPGPPGEVNVEAARAAHVHVVDELELKPDQERTARAGAD